MDYMTTKYKNYVNWQMILNPTPMAYNYHVIRERLLKEFPYEVVARRNFDIENSEIDLSVIDGSCNGCWTVISMPNYEKANMIIDASLFFTKQDDAVIAKLIVDSPPISQRF